MKPIIALIISFLAMVPAVSDTLMAGQTATGVVYKDLNANNQREKGEPGIAEVPVSNGVQVVLTDSKGRYEIRVADGQMVFVIKPSDYAYPMKAHHQPRFYHIHKPNGSPLLEYGGSPPTGSLPGAIDFGLIPKPADNRFTILVFGDPQPYTQAEVDYFYRGIVSELIGVKGVAFGISLGDLVGDDLDLFRPYLTAVGKIGIPWHHVIGNHDINFDTGTDRLSDETFERCFGPATYAFNHGRVHFIILDDILYPDPRKRTQYWGGLRMDQLTFIENDLKHVPKDFLVVLAVHIPFREEEGQDTFRGTDRTKLFELLKAFPHTLSLSAHTHIQRQDFFYKKDGWQQDTPHHQYNVGATAGDWYKGRLDKNGIPDATMRDGTPKGYGYVHFDRNQYTIDYKVAGASDAYRIRLHCPLTVQQSAGKPAIIAANFFMGSKRDTLHYRIDKGNWMKMAYQQTQDPFFIRQNIEWKHTARSQRGRRPSRPDQCEHLWFAELPKNLPPGNHTVEVKARDMFGRTFTQAAKYRILK